LILSSTTVTGSATVRSLGSGNSRIFNIAIVNVIDF
jgi:hypothetical protein